MSSETVTNIAADRALWTIGLRSRGLGVRLSPGAQPDTLADRLWSKVDQSAGPDACWPWTRAKNPKGYGQIQVGSRTVGKRRPRQAHRVAYELTFGPLPDGAVIRHLCNNTSCCNPKHLALGTQADNMRDMVIAGRSLAGERNHQSKLTTSQVFEIIRRRANGEGVVALGFAFGVSDVRISQICRGDGWSHLQAVKP